MTQSPYFPYASIHHAKSICLIVGIACLIGFTLGTLAIGLPPNIRSLQWRVEFLQQFGDRSISLLFGTALTLWGLSASYVGNDSPSSGIASSQTSHQRTKSKFPKVRKLFPKARKFSKRLLFKQLTFVCVLSGLFICLLSIFVIQDTITLRTDALAAIDKQAANLKSQIKLNQDAPKSLSPDITPELIEQASQDLDGEAELLKRKTRSQITRAGVVSLGNLLIVGIGLIALGRWGMLAP